MPRQNRMDFARHQERLRYWRDYYRRRRSHIFRRAGKTTVTGRIEATFRQATPSWQRAIQGRHRTGQRIAEITKLRLSIAGKKRQLPTKTRVAMLLGTRRSGQKRRGSRTRKGI